ncbi:MAG: cobyric acid synthase, partial [Muribaculaceae bacterium]|nr:cobyric acid synthase [Muribaculaceae bacterium]
MKRLSPIMLGGTGSDVGKSLIATGLCRIFLQDGYRPAPFKAQNMALNSYATSDGREIGRAQAVQAEAAGIECSTDMNPILLKPSGEMRSQVVINGVPHGDREAYQYFRKEGKEELRKVAHEAFDRLASNFNPVVLEGAGSIAELNLKDGDIVNMSMAEYADANVILVADIDRGGVFASAYGSIMLQDASARRRIKGIIVNKFRGDLRLFDDGRRMMEKVCGVPVLGVVPVATHIHIEEEDSVAIAGKGRGAVGGKVNVAVVLLKHISNFTDFDVLERRPEVNLYYAAEPEDLSAADIVIVPGSKNTQDDLLNLRKSGMSDAICKAREEGKT